MSPTIFRPFLEDRPHLPPASVDRSLAHRPTALLVAALLLFTWTGDVLGQQACPHHSSVPGAAAHAQDSAEHDHHADAAAEHASHGAAMEMGDHDSPAHHPDGEHSACTCMGSCPSAAGVALPAESDAGLRVAPAWVRDARREEAKSVPARLLPFFLPYANAPPSLG